MAKTNNPEDPDEITKENPTEEVEDEFLEDPALDNSDSPWITWRCFVEAAAAPSEARRSLWEFRPPQWNTNMAAGKNTLAI